MTKAAVIGLGTMGPGIAATLARGGMTVTTYDTMAEQRQRAADGIRMATGILASLGVPDRSGNRRSFTGTPEQIADDVRAFGKIGVHELIFDFRGQSMAESVERLQRFAEEVKPIV